LAEKCTEPRHQCNVNTSCSASISLSTMIFGTPEAPIRDSTGPKKTTCALWLGKKNLSNRHRRPLSQTLSNNLRKFYTSAFGVLPLQRMSSI